MAGKVEPGAFRLLFRALFVDAMVETTRGLPVGAMLEPSTS